MRAAVLALLATLAAGAAAAQAPTLPPQADPFASAGASPVGGPLDGIGPVGAGPIALGGAILTAGVAITFLVVGGANLVTSRNVLDNATRREIFEHIRSNPGMQLRDVSSRLGLTPTNVLWHVRKLQRARLVTARAFDGHVLYTPVEGGDAARRAAIGANVLSNPHAVNVLLHIDSHPGVSQREIARAMDVNHGTVRWHVHKLTRAGLLAPIAPGSSAVAVTADGRTALARATKRTMVPVHTETSTQAATWVAPFDG